MEGDGHSSSKKSSPKEISVTQDVPDAWGRAPKPDPVPIAEMPVHKFSEFYNMKHKSRGQAIIFNHEHFDDSTLKSRSGTSLDCVNLGERLRKLGFRVRIYNDLKFADLKDKVNKVAEDDHTDCDCFFMAVLSHGERDILYTKDVGYKPDVLWTPFTADKCTSLAGKPKLFFIQACQGDRFDSGVILRRTEVDGSSQYSIPSHADFLIAYSTIPGFFSWRNATKGSWFVQALCEELRERGAKLDILTLLTFVNQRVALNFESNVPTDEAMNRKKQIPCITSMLTRRLIFTGLEEEA